VWMLHGSCVSERPACSRSAGGLAASGAVPGAVEQVTSLALLCLYLLCLFGVFRRKFVGVWSVRV